ncbi:acyl carrier protein [Tsukamurella tyrosinosolvens]|uniref:acyl carrier protein n=2 Tax=Tsukamurella tyrosinosolvens TaxID=57704 RepID=UPI001CE1D3A3|nr:acyl carrier protein [Tsukamurella tyrosinosolvens]WEL91588.1 acyl carrier protein [Tsukamurella tyrosinosolvens]
MGVVTAKVVTAGSRLVRGAGATQVGGAVDEVIRSIVAMHGRLTRPIAEIAGGDDLFALGLTSHAAVNVMLAVEDRFAIEFPDAHMSKNTFSTLDSIAATVRELAG